MPGGFLVPPEKEKVRMEGRNGVNMPGANGVEKERVGIALAATGFIVPNLP